MTWWAKLLGLDDDDSAKRTEEDYWERGKENLGQTPPDSENSDPQHSCGGQEGKNE